MTADIFLERSLPYSIDSEKAVIAAILLDESAYFRASEILRPEDYYFEAHRVQARRMDDIMLDGRGLDPITLVEELRRHDELEKAGGIAYIAGLTDGMPRSINVEHYARTVKEKSTLRLLIRLSQETMVRCFQAEEHPTSILEDHEAKIFEIAARDVRSGLEPASNLISGVYREIEEIANHKTVVQGLETGFTELDRITGGLTAQSLVIVAARPGLGKTSLCMNIASHAAIRRKKHVAFFSLEMSKNALLKRVLAGEAEVDAHKIRTGFLNREDWNRLGRAAGDINQSGLSIDDAPNMTVLQIRAKSQRMASEHGLDLVIVDYLQLLAGSGRKYDNRTHEVTEISRGLKMLSKELNIPVIAISQLNREVEKRSGSRRPQLSDLRESGAIEQDADLVVFISRDEVTNPTEENEGLATITIAKQRDGSTGEFNLAFIKQCTKFANLYQESEQRNLYE
jgi:replicative DNA helicase